MLTINHRNIRTVATKVTIPKDAKSFQIKNNSYLYTLFVAPSPNELGAATDRTELRPRTTAVWEIKKGANPSDYILYMRHDGPAGTVDAEFIFNSYYSVGGESQGDLNPTRPFRDYTEYTAANDNENIAYNVATAFIGTLNGHRVRDVMIKAQTNGCLIGFDNQVALARGPPVVALGHIDQGETFIMSDMNLSIEITLMNAVAGANINARIWVAGD